VHAYVPRDADAVTLTLNLARNRLTARCTLHRRLASLTTQCRQRAERVRVAVTLLHPPPAAAARPSPLLQVRPLRKSVAECVSSSDRNQRECVKAIMQILPAHMFPEQV
jgi:hypothetical protein